MTLTEAIKAEALRLGFDEARVTPLAPPLHGRAFTAWLDAGHHGEMAYLADRAALRADPGLLAPGAASGIMLLVNYNPGPPPPGWTEPAVGRFARYAWSADYHDVIKARLFMLDAFIRERTGRTTLGKACVDSAPLLERDFALAAGLGFPGKNTVLITPGSGSYTFLAALLVPETLELDPPPSEQPPLADETEQTAPEDVTVRWSAEPAVDRQAAGRERARVPLHMLPETPSPRWTLPTGPGTCGACHRCLAACPTAAFVGPYVLDARRCISYLTIELRGPIPRELRPRMGNWVFGCDVCQEVCPYNRDPAVLSWPALAPDPARAAPPLLELLALDEAGFRSRFRGTAVLRTKRRGLVRNACVAAGNWGDPAAVSALLPLLADAESLVRGHAAWALGRIGTAPARAGLASRRAAETNPYVIDEIDQALEESAL